MDTQKAGDIMDDYAYEKEHAEAVRKMAAECTVLLKKDGQFPIKEPGRVALFGSGARNTIKGGTGSGEVNSRYFVNIEEGLKSAGFTVTTKNWLDEYDNVKQKAHKAFVKEIKARAKANHTLAIIEGMGAVMPEPEYEISLEGEGEICIYVLARISGEGADRKPVKGDVLLTDTEVRDICELDRKYSRFMLVLNVGGPVDLSPVNDVKNILLLSQLGVETGNTLADIILGKSYPSGKLTTTWTSWKDYPAIGDFGDANETRYREGVFVGYRYFDSMRKKPMYPFGYGLGFTDFECRVESADEKEIIVRIKNTGCFPGKETIQVYIAPPFGKIAKPVRTLVAFEKTKEILPGEEITVSVLFDIRDAATYDEGLAAFILEKGDYIVIVNDKPAVMLRLEEEIITRKLKNLLGKPGFIDWEPEKKEKTKETQAANETRETEKTDNTYEANYTDNLDNYDVITITRASISVETVCYEYEFPVEPEISELSDEELVLLNIGGFDPKGGLAGMIGNSGKSVAGAAGETAHIRDLPFLVMADGPAGVRISKDYIEDEKGVHPVGSSLPETMLEYLNGPARLALKLALGKGKNSGDVRHQYCTAIPIGTAIAQSWDTDLAEKLGDIVGDEMERFGVHLWLAPALNIHRSILCGRNFEYYSEDPLISGKFAVAITRGVQKHPGCGTTIKHFAANNQEYNRTGNNSRISERALREIYLRGFEICIRESQPHALMTSYNLINGVHSAERRDLCVDILRCEWGYKGIVMTDWVIGQGPFEKKGGYRNSLSEKVAAAGGALFMPGGKGDYDRLLNALKSGEISRKQLEENASTVFRMSRMLSTPTHQ